MSEYVQALELRISDNAKQAASGLDKLAASLSAIKSKVAGNLGLGHVNNQLQTFVAQIKKVGSDDNIAAINRLTNAINELVQAAGGLSHIKGGFAAVERMANRVNAAAGGTARNGGRSIAEADAAGVRDAGMASSEAIAEVTTAVGNAAAEIGEATGTVRANLGDLMNAINESVANSGSLEQLEQRIANLKQTLAENLASGKIKQDTEAFYRATAAIARLVAQHDKLKEAMDREAEAAHAVEVDSSSVRQADDAVKALTSDLAEAKRVATEILPEGSPLPPSSLRGTGGRTTFEGRPVGPEPIKDLGKLGFAATLRRREAAEARKELELSGGAAEKLGEAFLTANGKLGLLAMQIKAMKEDLGRGIASGDMDAKHQAALGQQIQRAEEKLIKMRESMTAVKDEARLTAEAAASIGKAFVDANGKAGLIAMEIRDKEAQLGSTIASGDASQTQLSRAGQEILRLRERLDKVTGAHEKAEEAAESHGSALKRLKDALWSANGGLFSFIKGMARMARYRIFRSLIREISEGFSTGLTNVREYSKAINGLYAQDMQGLDNQLAKMKNSLGAALAPAIQALIPLFQRLSQAVIEVSNWINQFFALINGATTWTRAIDYETEAIEDNGRAAGGAAKKVQNLLASWDELNIIQSKSGGGGGGSAVSEAEDYTRMFEEVSEFDTKIRDLIAFLRDNIPMVDGLLAGVGARLLGLSFPAAITISGIVWSFEGGKQSGASGDSLIESLRDNIPGILAGALGGAGIGFALAPNGAKIKGAIVGFFLGAAVSIFANVLGWQQGDNETVFDGPLFGENLFGTVYSILSGAALGASIGLLAGGAHGALLGFGIGATVGIFIRALTVDKESANTVDYSPMSFENTLGNNISSILMSAGAGLILGAKYGGLHGAIIGLTIGAVAGIVITAIQYNAERSARIDSIKNDLRDAFEKEFYDMQVTAVISAVNVKVEDVASKRTAVTAALAELGGRWRVMLQVGIDNVSADELEQMAQDVQTVCEQIQAQLGSERGVVYLSTNIFGENAPEGFDATALLGHITVEEDIITGIGTTIGRLLREGTEEEFREVIPAVMSILNQITASQQEAAASAEYSTGVASARRRIMEDGVVTEEELISFYELHEELIGNVEESGEGAYQTLLEGEERYLSRLRHMAENPDYYAQIGQDVSWVTPEVIAAQEAAVAEMRSDTYFDSFIARWVASIIGDDSMYEDALYGLAEDFFGPEGMRSGAALGIYGHGSFDLSSMHDRREAGLYIASASKGQGDITGTWHVGVGVDNGENFTEIGGVNPNRDDPDVVANTSSIRGMIARAYVRRVAADMREFVANDTWSSDEWTRWAGPADTTVFNIPGVSSMPVFAELSDAAKDIVATYMELGRYVNRGQISETSRGNVMSTLFGADWLDILRREISGETTGAVEEATGSTGGGGAPAGVVVPEGGVGQMSGTYVGTNNGIVYGGGGGAPTLESGMEDSEDEEQTRFNNQVIAALNTLINKEWTVEVSPSARWGGMNARSKELYEKAKG